MNDGYGNRKRYVFYAVIGILCIILFILVCKVASAVEQMFAPQQPTASEDSYGYYRNGRPEYLVDGQWYVQKANVETILLIGIDKYESSIKSQSGYRNTQQADALFLLALDHDAKTYHILHINRDTMANIRALDLQGNPYNSFQGQLAIAHTYGSGREDSCKNVIYSVSDYLYGLQVDHFISFSMDAVAVINDGIGGVTLVVEDDLTPVDATMVQGCEITLKGSQALSYIRARSELADSTNLSRMKRQRHYVAALLEQGKAKFEEDSGLLSRILLDVSAYMISDCPANSLLSLAESMESYTQVGIDTVEGIARKGERFMEFYADEGALRKQVLDLYYEPRNP